MKKNFIMLAVAAALVAPVCAMAADGSNSDAKTGPVLYGYAQITGAQQFGTSMNGVSTGSNGLVFGANRIRLGVKGQAATGVTYNIMAGWDNAAISGNNTSSNGNVGNLLNNGLGNGGNASIIDAWINYAPVPFVQLKVGKFKQPVGNEYVDVDGNALPFIFRSMGQSLLPGRSAGAMLHASNVMGTGVGYAVAIADETSLDYGSAYNWLVSGSNPLGSGQGGFLNGGGGYLASARLTYDFMGPLLHAEISGSRMTLPTTANKQIITSTTTNFNVQSISFDPFVISGDTNTVNTYYIPNVDSLYTWNVGVHGGLMGISYAAGYTNLHTGTTRDGNPGFMGQDWNVGLATNLHTMGLTPSWLDIEPAVRFDSFSYNDYQGDDAKLDNTTVGLNYYVNPNNPHAAEIQVNYIIPTARDGKWGANAPINGMAYNTLMLQFQAGF
ncbi:porin [Candidatus Igneacidithiobacillus taiwanensis]|uniref:porin n=1 Tax=Candidatus Igneacidithiobacillus taiwanensis TaxID=1945924 RepID=UPI0028A0FCF3|nr:porin [Candidatus Igneacidithiobacillus taiwanensis]